MLDKIKNVEWANLGLLWFIGDVVKVLLNLYQSNEPGFGARLFIIVALVIIALLVCKFLLPWLAGLAVQHVAGAWVYAITPMKMGLSSAVINGCTWICKRVCWAGRKVGN
ncbi:hypothetical protein [Rahnella sp. PCH160]|uniref:hypothetical protein n=1 Tax=Rahnella sp. PCH160 TaxID=3447928 RepID=UPI0039FD8D30